MRISDWSSDVCSSDLGPFGADEAETDGEPFYLAHGHGDVRIARHRGEAARAAAGDLIAVDAVDQPGGRHGRADQGDDVIVFAQSVDAIGACEAKRSLTRFDIAGVFEALRGLGSQERRVGKECVRTFRYRWAQINE